MMVLYTPPQLKCDHLFKVAFIMLSPNNPPPTSQDPLLYAVCGADLLPNLVRASVRRGEGHLVPYLLLPLSVNADG